MCTLISVVKCITIKYIVRSFVCPNCCHRQYIIGSESLYMLDVDFCYIYLI